MTLPRRRLTSRAVLLLTCGLFPWLLPVSALGKTIVITDADCQQMAAICVDAPRMSWAATYNAPAEFGNHYIDVSPKVTFLIRYPLEKIPPGNKITKAEWTIPSTQSYPVSGVRVNVRRCLVSWGAGVCHLYRSIRPEPLARSKPGAAGVGQDRAAKATASAVMKGTGEQVFNVTEDVELWYTAAVENHGWLVTVEDPDTMVRMNSPFWSSPKGWKLKITYEPK